MASRLAYVDWINNLVLVSDFSPEGAWQSVGGEECSWGLSSSAPSLRLYKLATNLLESLISHSGSQRSKISFVGLQSRFKQDCVPSGDSREESISLPFSSFLKLPTFFWLMATHHSDFWCFCHISFSALDSPASVCSLYEPCDYSGSIRIIQDDLPILRCLT